MAPRGRRRGSRGRGRGTRWRGDSARATEACQGTSRGMHASIKQENQDDSHGDIQVKSFEDIMAEKRRRQMDKQAAAGNSGAVAAVRDTCSTPGGSKDSSPVHSGRSAVSDPGGVTAYRAQAVGAAKFNNDTGLSSMFVKQEPCSTVRPSTPVRPLASILTSASSSPLGAPPAFGTPVVVMDRLSLLEETELARLGVMRTPSNSPASCMASPNRTPQPVVMTDSEGPADLHADFRMQETTNHSKDQTVAGETAMAMEADQESTREKFEESPVVGQATVKAEMFGGSSDRFGDSSITLGLRNLLEGCKTRRSAENTVVQAKTANTPYCPVVSQTVTDPQTSFSERHKPPPQHDVIAIDSLDDENDTGHSAEGKRWEGKVSGGQQGVRKLTASSFELVSVKKEPEDEIYNKPYPNLSPLPATLTYPYRNNTKDTDRPEVLRAGPLTEVPSGEYQDARQPTPPVEEQTERLGTSRNLWDIVTKISANNPEPRQPIAEPSDIPLGKQTVPEQPPLSPFYTGDGKQTSGRSTPDSDSYTFLIQSVAELSKLDQEPQTSRASLEDEIWSSSSSETTGANHDLCLNQHALVMSEHSSNQQLSIPTSSSQTWKDGTMEATHSLCCSSSPPQPSIVSDPTPSETGEQDNMNPSPPRLLCVSEAHETFPLRPSVCQASEKTDHIIGAEIVVPSVSEESDVDMLSALPALMCCTEMQMERTDKEEQKCHIIESAKGQEDKPLLSVDESPMEGTSQHMSASQEDRTGAVSTSGKTVKDRRKPTKVRRQSARLRQKCSGKTQVKQQNSLQVEENSSQLSQVVENLFPVEDNLSQVEENVPQMEENLPQVEQNLPQVEENLPQVEENLPQVEENLPQVEENLPQVEENLPQVEENLPQVEENLPQVEENLPQVEENLPQVEENLPQVEENLPQVEENLPQVEENLPQVEENLPQVEENLPQVEENLPQMEENLPQMEENLPQMEENFPQVEENFPQMEENFPQVEENFPQIQQNSPQMQQNSPQMQQSSPQIQQNSPQMQQNSPQMQQSSPQMQQNLPQVQQNSPQMQQNSPQMQQNSPQMQQNSPQMQQNSPQMQQNSPQMQQNSPQMQQNSPQMQQNSPQMQQNSPVKTPVKTVKHRRKPTQVRRQSPRLRQKLSGKTQIEQDSPWRGHTSSLVEQNSPQLEENSPQLEENSPQVGQNSPQVGQNSPQLGQNSPQVGQNSPQVGQNSPQLGQNSPQVGQNSPQVGQNSPQLGQNSPQVGQDSPQLGQNSPQVGQDSPLQEKSRQKPQRVGGNSPCMEQLNPVLSPDPDAADPQEDEQISYPRVSLSQETEAMEEGLKADHSVPHTKSLKTRQKLTRTGKCKQNSPKTPDKPHKLPKKRKGRHSSPKGAGKLQSGNSHAGNKSLATDMDSSLSGSRPKQACPTSTDSFGQGRRQSETEQPSANLLLSPTFNSTSLQDSSQDSHAFDVALKMMPSSRQETKSASTVPVDKLLEMISSTDKTDTRAKPHCLPEPDTPVQFAWFTPLETHQSKATSTYGDKVSSSGPHKIIAEEKEASAGSLLVSSIVTRNAFSSKSKAETKSVSANNGEVPKSVTAQHSPLENVAVQTPSALNRLRSTPRTAATSTPAYTRKDRLVLHGTSTPTLSPIICSPPTVPHKTRSKGSYALRKGRDDGLKLASLASPAKNNGTSSSACGPSVNTVSPLCSPSWTTEDDAQMSNISSGLVVTIPGGSKACADQEHEVGHAAHRSCRDTRACVVGDSDARTASFSQSYITMDTTTCSYNDSDVDYEEDNAVSSPESTISKKRKWGMVDDLRMKLTKIPSRRMPSPPVQRDQVSIATMGPTMSGNTSSWKSPGGSSGSDNDDALSLFVSGDEVFKLLADDETDMETSRNTQWNRSLSSKPSPIVYNLPVSPSDSPDTASPLVHRTQGGLIVKLPQRAMKRRGSAMRRGDTSEPVEAQTAGPSALKRPRITSCSTEGDPRPMEMGNTSTGRGDEQQMGQHDSRHDTGGLPLPNGYCRKHFLSERGCPFRSCKFKHRLPDKEMALNLIAYISGQPDGRRVPVTVYSDYVRLLIQTGDTVEAVKTFKILSTLPQRNTGELTLIVDELTDNLLSMQCWDYLQEVLLLVLQMGIMPNDNVLLELIQHYGDNNNLLAIRQLMDQYDILDVRPEDAVVVLVESYLGGANRPPSRGSLSSEEDIDERRHEQSHRHYSRVKSERISYKRAPVSQNAHSDRDSTQPYERQEKPSQTLWPLPTERHVGTSGEPRPQGPSHIRPQMETGNIPPLGIVNPQPSLTMESFTKRLQFMTKSSVPAEEFGKQLGTLYSSMKTTIGDNSDMHVRVLRALLAAVSSQEWFADVFHAMLKTLGHSGEDAEVTLHKDDVDYLGRIAVSLLLEARERVGWEQGYHILFLMHSHNMLYDELHGLSDDWSEEDQWRVSNAALQMCLKNDGQVVQALEVLKGRDDEWQCPPVFFRAVYEERVQLLQEILAALTLTTENAEDYFTLMDTIKSMGVNVAQQWIGLLKQTISDRTADLAALVSEQMMRRQMLNVNVSGDIPGIITSLVDLLGQNDLEDEARKVFLHGSLQNMYQAPSFLVEGNPWDLYVPTALSAMEMKFYVECHFKTLSRDLMRGKFEGDHLTMTLWHSAGQQGGEAEDRAKLNKALQEGFGFKHGTEFIGQVVRGSYTVVMYFCAILDWLQRTDAMLDESMSALSEYVLEDDSSPHPSRPPSQGSVDSHFMSLTEVLERRGNNEDSQENSMALNGHVSDVPIFSIPIETKIVQNEGRNNTGQAAGMFLHAGTSGEADQVQPRSSLQQAQLHNVNPAGYRRMETEENRNQGFKQPTSLIRPLQNTVQQFVGDGSQIPAHVESKRGTQYRPGQGSFPPSSNSILGEYPKPTSSSSILGEYPKPYQGLQDYNRGHSAAHPRPLQPVQGLGLQKLPIGRTLPMAGNQPYLGQRDNTNYSAGAYMGQHQSRRNDINQTAAFPIAQQHGHRDAVINSVGFPMGQQHGRRHDVSNTAGVCMAQAQGHRGAINNTDGYHAGQRQGHRDDASNITAGFHMGRHQGHQDVNNTTGFGVVPQQFQRGDINNTAGFHVGHQQIPRLQGMPQHSQARVHGNHWRQDVRRNFSDVPRIQGRISPDPPPPPPPPPQHPRPLQQGYFPGMSSPPKSFKTVSRPQQGMVDIYIRQIREEIESRVQMCGQIDKEHIPTLVNRLLKRFLAKEQKLLSQRPHFDRDLQLRVIAFCDCNWQQEYRCMK